MPQPDTTVRIQPYRSGGSDRDRIPTPAYATSSPHLAVAAPQQPWPYGVRYRSIVHVPSGYRIGPEWMSRIHDHDAVMALAEHLVELQDWSQPQPDATPESAHAVNRMLQQAGAPPYWHDDSPPPPHPDTIMERPSWTSLRAYYDDDQSRLRSPEADYGVHWRLHHFPDRWRVSYVRNTGELYAVNLAPKPGPPGSDGPVIVLGHLPADPNRGTHARPTPYYQTLDRVIRGWTDHCGPTNGLLWLIDRLAEHHAQAGPAP